MNAQSGSAVVVLFLVIIMNDAPGPSLKRKKMRFIFYRLLHTQSDQDIVHRQTFHNERLNAVFRMSWYVSADVLQLIDFMSATRPLVRC